MMFVTGVTLTSGMFHGLKLIGNFDPWSLLVDGLNIIRSNDVGV